MTVTVGRWGRSLAVRVPTDVAGLAGLCEGERVEIETVDGDIVIRRHEARAEAEIRAAQAAAEIIADSKRHSLGMSIREALDEGRRF